MNPVTPSVIRTLAREHGMPEADAERLLEVAKDAQAKGSFAALTSNARTDRERAIVALAVVCDHYQAQVADLSLTLDRCDQRTKEDGGTPAFSPAEQKGMQNSVTALTAKAESAHRGIELLSRHVQESHFDSIAAEIRPANPKAFV